MQDTSITPNKIIVLATWTSYLKKKNNNLQDKNTDSFILAESTIDHILFTKYLKHSSASKNKS